MSRPRVNRAGLYEHAAVLATTRDQGPSYTMQPTVVDGDIHPSLIPVYKLSLGQRALLYSGFLLLQ